MAGGGGKICQLRAGRRCSRWLREAPLGGGRSGAWGVFGCVAGKEKWSCCLREGERPWLRGRRRSWLWSVEVGERLRGENGGLCGEESPARKGDGFPG